MGPGSRPGHRSRGRVGRLRFRVTSSKAMALITASILCLVGISLAADNTPRVEQPIKTLTLDLIQGEKQAWDNLYLTCKTEPWEATIDLFKVGISHTYVANLTMAEPYESCIQGANNEITFKNVIL